MLDANIDLRETFQRHDRAATYRLRRVVDTQAVRVTVPTSRKSPRAVRATLHSCRNQLFFLPAAPAGTYERWAAMVPDGFTFSVKVAREITHELRLMRTGPALDTFLVNVRGLGDKLGPLLFQLAPSLAFDPRTVRAFFRALRTRFDASVVCEPRHPDWFTACAEALLLEFKISRVATDPPAPQAAGDPSGDPSLVYYRLHGSPRVYYSEYQPDQLERFAEHLARAVKDRRPAWCIFDNTAAGAATANALTLQERLGDS